MTDHERFRQVQKLDKYLKSLFLKDVLLPQHYIASYTRVSKLDAKHV